MGAVARTSPEGLIDLGYAKHVPTYLKTTASGQKIAIYKNIRFANPPTGNLRFRLPNTDLPKVEGVQNGRVPEMSNNCISSMPAYAPYPPYNGTSWGQEDCLFLDVYIPDGLTPGEQLPVLHFFVGSAYAFGSKEMFFSPMGLFDIMENKRFIFVANNYRNLLIVLSRLGVSGWAYMPGQDMVANAGLHDCLAAAKWTSKYIHLFGGDPNRVTVMGESSGAAIIGLLTALNSGKGKLPFQQAFISSPDIPPRRNPINRQQNLFQMILNGANCHSLECLRSLTQESMLRINDYLINTAPSDAGGGVFGPAPGFGPVLDGGFIPDMLQAFFQQGKYHKELRSLIIGNTAYEGMTLSHDVGLPAYFPTMVRQILSTASNATVADIQSYYNYGSNPAKLAWDWTTDVLFASNAANIAAAYSTKSRRYIFSIPPSIHGQDLSYYFYVDQETTPVDNIEIARSMQKILLRFLYGHKIDWPIYGADKQIINVTVNGYEYPLLPADLKARSDMINRVVLDPTNGV
ncbi:putative lipase 2 [Xylogone sp. PMI_703]|nr:putative lipase 2 [Xylogone sp. PMI_703]